MCSGRPTPLGNDLWHSARCLILRRDRSVGIVQRRSGQQRLPCLAPKVHIQECRDVISYCGDGFVSPIGLAFISDFASQTSSEGVRCSAPTRLTANRGPRRLAHARHSVASHRTGPPMSRISAGVFVVGMFANKMAAQLTVDKNASIYRASAKELAL